MASKDVLYFPQSGLRTVLIVDIKDSVPLMAEDGFDAVQRWLRLRDHLENTVLPAHGGRLVKSTGDGVLLEFQSVRPALQTAFAIQQVSVEANFGISPHRQLHLKMGIQSGELIVDSRDVYGHAVNMAARLATLAGPGEILVSSSLPMSRSAL